MFSEMKFLNKRPIFIDVPSNRRTLQIEKLRNKRPGHVLEVYRYSLFVLGVKQNNSHRNWKAK